jgi:thioester reductase-like protein
MYNLFYDKHSYKVDWDNWTLNEDLSAAYVIKLLQENIDHPELFMRLIGEAKKINDKDLVLDNTFKKAINQAKEEQNKNKHKDNRYNRRYSNKIEDKVKRTKYNIHRTTKRINTLSKSLEKSQAKLPIFLEKLKRKKERERIKRLKEKAEKRKKYLLQLMNTPEEYEEEEYETPAFLSNKIAIDDVIPGTITTYEIMDDEYMI